MKSRILQDLKMLSCKISRVYLKTGEDAGKDFVLQKRFTLNPFVGWLTTSSKGKCKVVPMLNYTPCHEDVGGMEV